MISLEKTNKKRIKKLIEMPRNNSYKTGILLDFSYHKNYYKVIGIDLSIQTNTSIPQQINFIVKLEGEDGAAMFFIAEKQEKAI